MEASNEAVIIRTDKKMVCFPAQLEPCMSELSILWVSIPTQSCIESRGSKKKKLCNASLKKNIGILNVFQTLFHVNTRSHIHIVLQVDRP